LEISFEPKKKSEVIVKKRLILLLCATTGIGIIAFAQITPSQKPAAPATTDVSQMRDEIKRLQAKVELLEYRTKSLESTVEQMKRSHTPSPLTFTTPPPAAAPSLSAPGTRSTQPPTIWGQGEVNGWSYYIVPCVAQSR
jgi:hypothetical protein